MGLVLRRDVTMASALYGVLYCSRIEAVMLWLQPRVQDATIAVAAPAACNCTESSATDQWQPMTDICLPGCVL